MPKQKFYQKAGVQASFVAGVFAVVAAVVVAASTGYFKKAESPLIAVATPVIDSPTAVHTQSPLAPTPEATPSPSPSTTGKDAARQTAPPQTAATPRRKPADDPDLSERESRLKEREQALNAERDARLNGYIDEYLAQYSQVDLGGAPCDPEAIKEKHKAEALLDLIESLSKEAHRNDILDKFVRQR